MATAILQCEKSVRRKLRPSDRIPRLMKCGAPAEDYTVKGKAFTCGARLCHVHAELARGEGFVLVKRDALKVG